MLKELASIIDQATARRLLASTMEPRDRLPYTAEFDRLHKTYCDEAGPVSKFDLMQAFFNMAKKGGFSGRKSARITTEFTIPQAVYIGKRLGRRLPARASLVYTDELDAIHKEFTSMFCSTHTKSEFWLNIDGMAKKAKGHEWPSQLQKAREAACLAVEVYNKPMVTFRSGAYIVLMNIAWTSLMHAILFRWGIKPYYTEDQAAKVDGDYKGWDLTKCLQHYFGTEASAVSENLKFFIGLRNKIEHRSFPVLDHGIFGECQAMLLNFEDMLFEQFGPENALTGSLALALQFSHLRSPEKTKAIRSFHTPLSADIAEYIESFRSSLSTDIRNNLEFSYRVFLIPKVANHEGTADLSVEFVKFDANQPDKMEQYEKLVTMLKPMVTQVANQGRLKASDVCKMVEPVVKAIVGPNASFSPSYHHAKACRLYEVRAQKGDANPYKTKTQFCHYDMAHKDFVYTESWAEFLIEEMKKPGQYQKIFS